MQYSMPYDEQVPVTVAPADSAGNFTDAALSNVAFVSADETIFTVAADPSKANAAVLTGIKVGTATLNITATATPAGQGSQPVQLSASVEVTLIPGATSQLIVTFGTPIVPNQ